MASLAPRRSTLSIAVQIEPVDGDPPAVDYAWDTETDILSASVRTMGTDAGLSGSIALEGSDGAWVVLDIAGGWIGGVEVAGWPPVRTLRNLLPPAVAEAGRARIAAGPVPTDVTSVEIEIPLHADADLEERNFHFSLGGMRHTRVVRLARDVLLEVDARGRLAGFWLLNVPPHPGEA